MRLWQAWFDEAVKAEPRDPTAMSLATVDADGMPDVRTVLLKGVDERGFVFYTNTESNKGRELAANPKAALLFYWKSLEPADPHPRAGRARDAGGGRRLFRHPPEGRADRRLGEPAVAPAGKPARLREGGRALRGEIRARRRAAPAALVRLSHRAHVDRVLARPARSACTTASNSAAHDLGEPWTKSAACIRESLMPNSNTNQPRRTLLLTGASRGIGHATVKRFSAAGWRVITCSRHGFPENCPWEMGPEDHIQVDLADRREHRCGDRRDQDAARRRRTACAGQQCGDLAQGGWRQAARLDRHRARGLEPRVPGEFLRADHAGARADRGARARRRARW